METVELAAGSHFLQPGSGLVTACALVVTDAGTWAFATECDGFLSGRGTDTLRLIGFTVTIDASPLSTPILLANLGVDQFGASPRPVTLLPTFADMLASPGPGVIAGCGFRVELDGTIAYSDEVQGCLTGRGTRAVTFHGFPVNVDARELSTPSFSIIQANSLMHQPSDVVQRYRLLPTATGYQYGAWTVSGILWPSLGLEIGLDGRIAYPASADGWVSGRGTDTLVIHGYTIQIDARAVPPNSFHIPDANAGNLSGAVHSLTLAPVSYLHFTGEPTDFRFWIRESNGAIEVGADAACGSAKARRSSSLAARCRSRTSRPTSRPSAAPRARIVRVSLSAPAPVDVTVDYATADGSRDRARRLHRDDGTLTIPAGRTGGPILVPINGDGFAEPDEQLTITLSNPRNATIARGRDRHDPQHSTPPDTSITAGPEGGSTVTTPPTFEFVNPRSRSRASSAACSWRLDDRPRGSRARRPTAGAAGGFSCSRSRCARSTWPATSIPPRRTRRYNHDPTAYGNFWIRGIDVFQVVQPNARARMYTYDPNNPVVSELFPINCGAGTPTAFRSSPRSGLRQLAEDRQSVTYKGVPLDIRKVTNASSTSAWRAPPPGPRPAARHQPDRDRSRHRGRQIGPGSPSNNQPTGQQHTVGDALNATAPERRYGVQFPFDASWLNHRNKINLKARSHSRRAPDGGTPPSAA